MMIGRSVLAGTLAVVLVGLFAPSVRAGTPSFDCDRAKSTVEKMICNDDELADLDVQIAKAFANTLARAPANTVNELRDVHRSWWRNLMQCGKSDDARGCTLEQYRRRLEQL